MSLAWMRRFPRHLGRARSIQIAVAGYPCLGECHEGTAAGINDLRRQKFKRCGELSLTRINLLVIDVIIEFTPKYAKSNFEFHADRLTRLDDSERKYIISVLNDERTVLINGYSQHEARYLDGTGEYFLILLGSKPPDLRGSRADLADVRVEDAGGTGLEKGIAHGGTLYGAADDRDAGGIGNLLHQVGIAGAAAYYVENVNRMVAEGPQAGNHLGAADRKAAENAAAVVGRRFRRLLAGGTAIFTDSLRH